MKLFFILTAILITGCSATRVQLQPRLINDQTITYVRGNSKLNSQSVLKPELTIIEYSLDEMLISLTVTNTTSEPILFSESNLTVELLASGELQAGTVYTFEQLAKEAADRGYDTAAQAGNTAAGVGVGFIPFGGIIYSVGRLFYSVGSQSSESYEERIDKLTFTQLNQNYLRQQTIEPGELYSGVLKIGFENDLEVGNTVIFSLSAGGEVEKFTFICEQAEEK
ncbi:hypothetical protein AU255_00590 [Methyloprofundus sedimenti]|uniref:Uncharacterized protein n=1 Tax=Methyloprofundus sedimenti TaxID=1420851 RepID=A0A1V8M4E7_9GAMM|nr:hypothetical protein [Methyloprofundus sedimenti]OQK16440.1 hypothetical protein AU255_00590 [Methyloprofundus sedimenti]